MEQEQLGGWKCKEQEFILKSFIQRHINAIPPKYIYEGETGVNPAFQRIEEVKRGLLLNEKRIFVLRSDFVLATGVKNAEQQHGYHGLQDTFAESQYPYINWDDRYGHPSLTTADKHYNGTVLYAGFICQREGYLELFLSSGRFNRAGRCTEGIYPLTDKQTHIIEAYLSLKFQAAYGSQNIVFYDTSPGAQDAADSALFFTNTAFPEEKKHRVYNQDHIVAATRLAYNDSHYIDAQRYIKQQISPIDPYENNSNGIQNYQGERGINPGYQDIESIQYRLSLNEKRIWALRGDFILATGVKNAYQKEHHYHGLEDCFSESVHAFLDWGDRYGHPSLTHKKDDTPGSAYYAGYICQKEDYLQVYLVSGRYERSDLSEEQTRVLEAYIAFQFQTAYGNQDIVFVYGNSNNPQYHATFFGSGDFDKTIPQRRYNQEVIQDILENIPETAAITPTL